MHPFALSRADDPTKAIAAHAQDPQLAFIAGGTDLIGLMKDRAQLPERGVALRAWAGRAFVRGRGADGPSRSAVSLRRQGHPRNGKTVPGGGVFIASIDVPACAEGRASHYLKTRDRQSYEFALVSAAAAVAGDGRRIRSARLALGGVAHKPWRLTPAEAALRGALLADIDGLRSAIATSFTAARPLADNAFKVELAQRVALRALQTAGARA